jgi:hypothetical protein
MTIETHTVDALEKEQPAAAHPRRGRSNRALLSQGCLNSPKLAP